MPDPNLPASPDAESTADKKQRRKADRARKAWISFAGRIIAQVVGAAASVVLGLLVVQKYQSQRSERSEVPAAAPAPASKPLAAVARRAGEVSIVVLPLANLSRDASQEYFADGMTEALTARLAQVKGLTVISRTSAMRYKTDQPAIPDIARALGVDLVVEGSVLQAGDQVRITAADRWRQGRTPLGAVLQLRDIIGLQDEVAQAIGKEIQGTVSTRPAVTDGARHAVDPAAYDLYLRGRHAWNQRDKDALQTAVDYFSKALAIDPDFALAHVGLADAYSMQGSPGRGLKEHAEPMSKAKAAAQRALELDGSLAEAHTAFGGDAVLAEPAGRPRPVASTPRSSGSAPRPTSRSRSCTPRSASIRRRSRGSSDWRRATTCRRAWPSIRSSTVCGNNRSGRRCRAASPPPSPEPARPLSASVCAARRASIRVVSGAAPPRPVSRSQ